MFYCVRTVLEYWFYFTVRSIKLNGTNETSSNPRNPIESYNQIECTEPNWIKLNPLNPKECPKPRVESTDTNYLNHPTKSNPLNTTNLPNPIESTKPYWIPQKLIKSTKLHQWVVDRLVSCFLDIGLLVLVPGEARCGLLTLLATG